MNILDELCVQLKSLSIDLDGIESTESWPKKQLDLCAKYGVFRWRKSTNGTEVLINSTIKLSSACLTTAFVVSQFLGALKRIEASNNTYLKDQLIPQLKKGDGFATLGISHLTTSRRHLAAPIVRARFENESLVINGYTPWVTGASFAKYVLVGATLDSGEEMLILVPLHLDGIQCAPPSPLLALESSQTGSVSFHNVRVEQKMVVTEPKHGLLSEGSASSGGFQTSALALGLATAAISYIEEQAIKRTELEMAAIALHDEWCLLREELIESIMEQNLTAKTSIRSRANQLVLRSTQSALIAAKGAGFVPPHPVGRWCKEALFFLVWSCPNQILIENINKMANLP
jgi:hypothetical protein